MKKIIIPLVFISSLLVGHLAVLAGSLHPEQNLESTRIHFINVDQGDAILLESNGRFGMIDAGQGSWNYRPTDGSEPQHYWLGYQIQVMEYVRRIAGDDNGNVHLEFIIISHIHSDHIGGFRELLMDETFTVDQIFMKYYAAEHRAAVSDFELSQIDSGQPWDSVQQLEGLELVATSRNIPIITEQQILNAPMTLGEFTIQLLSTEVHIVRDHFDLRGNQDSLAVLVTAGNRNVLLTADLTGVPQDQLIAELLASGITIDVVQVPHHGFSASERFIQSFRPATIIITNYWSRTSPHTRAAILEYGITAYTVGDNNGIVLDFALADFGLSNFQNQDQVGSVWVHRPEFGENYWFYQNRDTLTFATGWAFENSFNLPDPNKPGLVPTVNTYFLRRWDDDISAGPKGSLVTGWVEYQGHWFYFTPIATTLSGTNIQIPLGGMVRGWLVYANNLFYLNQRTTRDGLDGELLTGMQLQGGDWVSMYDPVLFLIGEHSAENLRTTVEPLTVTTERTEPLLSGWQLIDGHWYVMDSNGNPLTGWQEVGYNRYFLNHNGRRLTSWHHIDGNWFFFNDSGRMQTGRIVISGVLQLFTDEGHWQGPER